MNALRRLADALLDRWRALWQADDEMVETLAVLASFPSQRVLQHVKPHETEAVMRRLYRLRVACDANELDFGTLVDFAEGVHEAGGRTWTEVLDMAIRLSEERNRHDGP